MRHLQVVSPHVHLQVLQITCRCWCGRSAQQIGWHVKPDWPENSLPISPAGALFSSAGGCPAPATGTNYRCQGGIWIFLQVLWQLPGLAAGGRHSGQSTTVPWRNIVQLDGTRIYLRSQRHNLGGPQSRPEVSRQVQFVIPTSTPNIQKKSLGEKGSPGGKHSSLRIQFA